MFFSTSAHVVQARGEYGSVWFGSDQRTGIEPKEPNFRDRTVRFFRSFGSVKPERFGSVFGPFFSKNKNKINPTPKLKSTNKFNNIKY